MAVDTALKRKSISGIPFLIPGVTPDAAEPVAWRQAVAWSYSGIAPSVVVVPVVSNEGRSITVQARIRSLTAEARARSITVPARIRSITVEARD